MRFIQDLDKILVREDIEKISQDLATIINLGFAVLARPSLAVKTNLSYFLPSSLIRFILVVFEWHTVHFQVCKKVYNFSFS